MAKRLQQALERDFEDGEILFREGDDSREMYIIQSGAVLVTRRVGDRELVISRLVRGEFLGEMAMLESMPRTASARADGRTHVLVINAGGFLDKIRRDPTFAVEMMRKLSHRFRLLNDRVAELLQDPGRDATQVWETLRWTEYDAERPDAAPAVADAEAPPVPSADAKP